MRGSDLRTVSVFDPEKSAVPKPTTTQSSRPEAMPITVIKIGGSLLGWPDLPMCLSDLLQSRVNERHVLIVGGGAVVDEIRRLDQPHGLGDSPARITLGSASL